MAKKKNERNAGRKAEYDEPTKPVSFKLPISKIPEIKERFFAILQEYKLKRPGKNRASHKSMKN